MEKSATPIDRITQEFLDSIEYEITEPSLPENTVQEAQAVFQKKLSYRTLLHSPMLIVKSIRHGIPYAFFEEIQKQGPFTEEDWAGFLNISTKSLQRYKVAQNHIFKPIHSEKIFEMAEVIELGKEVFGDPQKFYRWLSTPSMGLGGNKPSSLITNSYGKELVIDALYRIDQGVFA